MQILESKLNYLTIEELDLLDPDPFKVVINKLLHIGTKENISQSNALKDFARKLALIETDRAANGKLAYGTILFHKYSQTWRATINVKGKQKHIKSSKDKAVVEKAYNEYISRL